MTSDYTLPGVMFHHVWVELKTSFLPTHLVTFSFTANNFLVPSKCGVKSEIIRIRQKEGWMDGGRVGGWMEGQADEWPALTLSKQTRFICPQILILCGLMQKIPMFFSRRCAYTIPAVMAAGSAGGTVMVTMSRDSIMMVLAGT